MVIENNKWHLPSLDHELDALQRTENDLCQALDMLSHISKSIPHTPASETKYWIDEFLNKFKKKP